MHTALLGAIIGERYLLTGVVGEGGMGVVFRAEDTRLSHRPCAVKLLTGQSSDPDEAQRFERELHIISRLRSQNVVQVLDTGILPDGRRYIVMELLEGLPLSAMLARTGPLSPARAIHIAKGVLAGLSEAHEHGIVHRDLKPANIFVTRSRTGDEIAKVLDFGIAKDTLQGAEADLTSVNMLIGTPKYMAPEQFLKLPADPRTDLYAVGLLFYQMLSGQPPFHADMSIPEALLNMPDEFRIGWLHVNQAPAELTLPAGLWAILARLLAKKPEARYEHAQQVIEALLHLDQRHYHPEVMQTGDNPKVHREAPSGTTGFPVAAESLRNSGQSRSSRPLQWALLAAGLVGAAGAAFWYVRQQPEHPQQPQAAAVVSLNQPTAQAQTCSTELHSDPPGATVRMGAKKLGETPLQIDRPCDEVWRIELQLEGHRAEALNLRGKASDKQSVTFKKRP